MLDCNSDSLRRVYLGHGLGIPNMHLTNEQWNCQAFTLQATELKSTTMFGLNYI